MPSSWVSAVEHLKCTVASASGAYAVQRSQVLGRMDCLGEGKPTKRSSSHGFSSAGRRLAEEVLVDIASVAVNHHR